MFIFIKKYCVSYVSYHQNFVTIGIGGSRLEKTYITFRLKPIKMHSKTPDLAQNIETKKYGFINDLEIYNFVH